MAGTGVALLTLLTACPRPYPPYVPPVTLNFQFPATPVTPDLRLAAFYFEQDSPGAEAKVKLLGTGYLSTYNTTTLSTGTISMDGSALNALKANAKCVLPFKGGETTGMQNVVVTPDTVKTCSVYFSLFRDVNGDGIPFSTEELYVSHDLYSYASSAFTYSFTSPDSRSAETGSRVAGWSVVRHEVLQPSDTPNRFVVTMNSVPTADETIAIRLHPDSDRLTSMGANGGLK